MSSNDHFYQCLRLGHRLQKYTNVRDKCYYEFECVSMNLDCTFIFTEKNRRHSTINVIIINFDILLNEWM